MRTLLFLFLVALAGPVRAEDRAPVVVGSHAVTISGTDEETHTIPFKVNAHWKVTCSAAAAGADFGVQVFAEMEGGTQSLKVLDVTAEGTQSAYVRDGGTWKLHIVGYYSTFKITVENDK